MKKQEKLEELIWDTLGTPEESERNYVINTVFGGNFNNLAKVIMDKYKLTPKDKE